MSKSPQLDKLAAATASMKEALANPSETEVSSTDTDQTEQITTDISMDQESAEFEASESSKEVKEDVKLEDSDEKGVPYKNRYSEAARKLEQQNKRIAELEAKMETLSKQTDDQALLSLRGALNDTTIDNSGVPSVYGQRQENQTPQEETPATIQDVYKVVSTLTAKERSDQEALKRYPDLLNPNSVLYKETQGRINLKARMGVNRADPFLLIETAAAAYGDLIATGKIVPRTVKEAQEKARRASADESTSITSRAVVKKPASTQMTEMEEGVRRMFVEQAGVKITPEQYLKRKQLRRS